jgi:hypothetical protein
MIMRIRLAVLVLLLLLPRPAGASWPSDPTVNVPLCLATGHQGEPQGVSDGKGGAIIAWDDQRSGPYDVYMQRVDARGTAKWANNGVALCALANDQFEPALASDGAGGAIIAWSDNRGATSYDIYAQRVDSTGTPKWTANGVAIAVAANIQRQPRILADGSGGAILAWTDERVQSGFPRIYVQHVNSSGSALWAANGVSTSTSGSGNRSRIVSDGAGGLLVAWEDFRSGDQDIYAQHVLSTGAVDPAWPIAGQAIATSFQEQPLSGLVADGNGGALIAWPQWNGTRDIVVQHLLSTGAIDPAWPFQGRKLDHDGIDQTSPVILSDGSGGVLVAYFHYWGTRAVRAKRVLASGIVDPSWPDTGLVLCQAPGERMLPAIVASDTAAIVVWQDQRNGQWDLYAHRFFRTGVADPAWPIDGRAISTANRDQVNHTLVPDGTGGVIVAWQDDRTNAGPFGDDGEIFAQAIKGIGQLGDPPVGVPLETSFDFDLRSTNPLLAGAVTIRFTLPSASPALLEVFNVAGRRVAGREVGSLGAGTHVVNLGSGWKAVPGVYFVQLSQERLTTVRKIVLLR